MKVLIHQGFHKTGTTTLQRTLVKNRARLRGRVNMLLPRDLQQAGFLAKRQAIAPKAQTLQRFDETVLAALQSVPELTDRPLLISQEELAGVIPGRKGVWSYGQTPVLARHLVQAVMRLVGTQADITLFYTTRAPADWIRSTYWQNLRSQRVREDLQDYGAALQAGADLEAVVARVRAQVGGQADVVSLNVSDCADRLAPLTRALSCLGLRCDDLEPVRDQNIQPPGSAAQLLALNRSDLTDAQVTAAKRDLLAALRDRPDQAR